MNNDPDIDVIREYLSDIHDQITPAMLFAGTLDSADLGAQIVSIVHETLEEAAEAKRLQPDLSDDFENRMAFETQEARAINGRY